MKTKLKLVWIMIFGIFTTAYSQNSDTPELKEPKLDLINTAFPEA